MPGRNYFFYDISVSSAAGGETWVEKFEGIQCELWNKLEMRGSIPLFFA